MSGLDNNEDQHEKWYKRTEYVSNKDDIIFTAKQQRHGKILHV